MIAKRGLSTAIRLFEIPKHIVARAIMGLFMVLVGFSYLYSSYSANASPTAVLSRFSIYGPDAPEIVAWIYIVCGLVMLMFVQHDYCIRAVFPNFLYIGMLAQLAINGQASWTGFLTTAGLTIIATIAVMRGVPEINTPKGTK